MYRSPAVVFRCLFFPSLTFVVVITFLPEPFAFFFLWLFFPVGFCSRVVLSVVVACDYGTCISL